MLYPQSLLLSPFNILHIYSPKFDISVQVYNFYTLCIFGTVYQELQVRVKCPRRLEHLLLPSKKLVIVMNIKTNGKFPTKIAKTVTKLFSKLL